MWFRVAEGIYIPASEVVGFFSPEAAGAALKYIAGGEQQDAGKVASRTRAVVLMRDGTTLASPFGVAALKERFRRPGV